MKIDAGLKLKTRKPGDRADERRAQQRTRLIAVREIQGEAEQPGDHGDAGGEAIHVVEQIHRVRDRDDPHEDDEEIHGPRQRRIEPEAHQIEQDAGANLRHELRLRSKSDHIVDQADREHADREQRKANQLLGNVCGYRHRDGESGEDADAAEPRSRPPMPAIRARLLDPPELERAQANAPRGSCRHSEGDGGDDENGGQRRGDQSVLRHGGRSHTCTGLMDERRRGACRVCITTRHFTAKCPFSRLASSSARSSCSKLARDTKFVNSCAFVDNCARFGRLC